MESRDVIGPSDFLGRTEEINEGSDSFAISTAMVEPLTEPTAVTTTKPDLRTEEPLLLTTRADKNTTAIPTAIVPSSHEHSQPLPEEAVAADPFSMDEEPSTEQTPGMPVIVPVVPVIPSTNDSIVTLLEPHNDSMSTTEAPEETDVTTMFGPHVPVVQTLEGRVLKEKEEVGMASTFE
ncbi:hypothetical protein OSTOST_24697 [Ostertagia ostertagi]